MMMDYSDAMGAVKIKDGLFIGDSFAANDIDFKELNKVTHVINCSVREIHNMWEQMGVKYLSYYWNDSDTQTILDSRDVVINEVVEFIQEALDVGESVLVHSAKGQSRSAVVILAYLMKQYNWSFQKAFQFFSSRRPDIKLKSSFQRQLTDFENRLISKYNGKLSKDWSTDHIEELSSEEYVLQNTFINASHPFKNHVPEDPNYDPYGPPQLASKLRWADSNNSSDRHKLEQLEPNTGYMAPCMAPAKNKSNKALSYSSSVNTSSTAASDQAVKIGKKGNPNISLIDASPKVLKKVPILSTVPQRLLPDGVDQIYGKSSNNQLNGTVNSRRSSLATTTTTGLMSSYNSLNTSSNSMTEELQNAQKALKEEEESEVALLASISAVATQKQSAKEQKKHEEHDRPEKDQKQISLEERNEFKEQEVQSRNFKLQNEKGEEEQKRVASAAASKKEEKEKRIEELQHLKNKDKEQQIKKAKAILLLSQQSQMEDIKNPLISLNSSLLNSSASSVVGHERSVASISHPDVKGLTPNDQLLALQQHEERRRREVLREKDLILEEEERQKAKHHHHKHHHHQQINSVVTSFSGEVVVEGECSLSSTFGQNSSASLNNSNLPSGKNSTVVNNPSSSITSSSHQQMIQQRRLDPFASNASSGGFVTEMSPSLSSSLSSSNRSNPITTPTSTQQNTILSAQQQRMTTTTTTSTTGQQQQPQGGPLTALRGPVRVRPGSNSSSSGNVNGAASFSSNAGCGTLQDLSGIVGSGAGREGRTELNNMIGSVINSFNSFSVVNGTSNIGRLMNNNVPSSTQMNSNKISKVLLNNASSSNSSHNSGSRPASPSSNDDNQQPLNSKRSAGTSQTRTAGPLMSASLGFEDQNIHFGARLSRSKGLSAPSSSFEGVLPPPQWKHHQASRPASPSSTLSMNRNSNSGSSSNLIYGGPFPADSAYSHNFFNQSHHGYLSSSAILVPSAAGSNTAAGGSSGQRRHSFSGPFSNGNNLSGIHSLSNGMMINAPNISSTSFGGHEKTMKLSVVGSGSAIIPPHKFPGHLGRRAPSPSPMTQAASRGTSPKPRWRL
eukprot:GDKJ01011927.1.p1 GENE.GDKJ01011927.1~~GDKJ01011927.1.p1  ORF type:complete len:1070 (-),score=274.17 GDKJ01011927.1:97-3306(-)